MVSSWKADQGRIAALERAARVGTAFWYDPLTRSWRAPNGDVVGPETVEAALAPLRDLVRPEK